MGRSKLERFRVIAERENVIQPGKDLFDNIKGTWNSFFKNNHDLVVEIGCGRGEYTTGLANLFPNKNFVGIDMKGARLWKGSTVAFEGGLSNVAFLRAQAQQLELFFEKGEVSEIWITFPDPRPKSNEEKLRLTNPRFLEIYKNILAEGGILNFKTDNEALFDYTLEALQTCGLPVNDLVYTKDLYNSELLTLHYNIQTTFEKKFMGLGMKINYLKFSF